MLSIPIQLRRALRRCLIIGTTETGAEELFNYWDDRERDTYIQITNICNANITVHVQVWDVKDNCVETNFFDTYTRFDTHIYDFADMKRNNGLPIELAGAFDGGYGPITVSITDFEGGCLIGNMRILDTWKCGCKALCCSAASSN